MSPPARGNQPMMSGGNSGSDPSKSGTNKNKVPRKYKKIKSSGKGKKTDKKQNSMINSLSRDIYKLKMSQFGSVQINYHRLTAVLTPIDTKPLCLDLTDFSCTRVSALGVNIPGADVFQAAATGTTVSSGIAHWGITGTNVLNNIYWNKVNADGPDTGKYLAMKMTYFISVTGDRNLDNTRIRFDVVSQRPGTVTTQLTPLPANAPLVLPFTLGYFRQLVGGIDNRISSQHFKKYYSKTIYINSVPSGTGDVHGTTGNTQNFSFTFTPNKLCVQNVTNPVFTPGNQSTADIGLGQWGPNNVPFTQPLWLIISTDDKVATVGDAVNIKIARKIVFRDHIGSAAI